MKILVVDDDKEIVQLLEIYIRNEGYEPISAYDGKEALTKLNTNPDIGLIILDLMMPEIDGMDVIKRVRKDSDIPILVLSAKTADMDKIQGLITGANDYVNKDSHEVKTIKGDVIQLTALEFGILYLLASHPNRVFSADDIFERVWQQESVVSAKTVMVHVSHLRDKIEEATNGEKVIQTVWGVGYKVEDH